MPGQGPVFEVGAGHGGEEPGADDLVGLGSEIHGEGPPEQVGVGLPSAGDLGAEGRGRPGVHHVRIAGEPARPASLRFRVTGRRLRAGIHRQVLFVRDDRASVVDLAAGVDRVPQRDGHPVEALPAHQPVAGQAVHPVLVPHPHVRRNPFELAPTPEERLPQVVVPPAVAEIPLAAGHDLQGTIALLEELDRVGDRTRVTPQVAGSGQGVGDGPAGPGRPSPRQAPVGVDSPR